MFNLIRWGNIHMAVLVTAVAAGLDLTKTKGREALS
jgi:hypothetical protein